LGILPDLWDAVPVKLVLKPGDIVLLITDGFLEWENSAGEQFGTERLAAAVRQFSHPETGGDYCRALRLSAEFCAGNSAARRSHSSPDQALSRVVVPAIFWLVLDRDQLL
jgi:stage II sporulation SpoE-like protein